MPDGRHRICPKNCTADLVHAVKSTPAEGPSISKSWPTLLGSYWEWVWGPVGDASPGVGYMHRPSSFPLLQFAREAGEPVCRNIEFPGRHGKDLAGSRVGRATAVPAVPTATFAALARCRVCPIAAVQSITDSRGLF